MLASSELSPSMSSASMVPVSEDTVKKRRGRPPKKLVEPSESSNASLPSVHVASSEPSTESHRSPRHRQTSERPSEEEGKPPSEKSLKLKARQPKPSFSAPRGGNAGELSEKQTVKKVPSKSPASSKLKTKHRKSPLPRLGVSTEQLAEALQQALQVYQEEVVGQQRKGQKNTRHRGRPTKTPSVLVHGGGNSTGARKTLKTTKQKHKHGSDTPMLGHAPLSHKARQSQPSVLGYVDGQAQEANDQGTSQGKSATRQASRTGHKRHHKKASSSEGLTSTSSQGLVLTVASDAPNTLHGMVLQPDAPTPYDMVEAIQKRKRGRPAKLKAIQQTHTPIVQPQALAALPIQPEDTVAIVPKKRGRPPKKKEAIGYLPEVAPSVDLAASDFSVPLETVPEPQATAVPHVPESLSALHPFPDVIETSVSSHVMDAEPLLSEVYVSDEPLSSQNDVQWASDFYPLTFQLIRQWAKPGDWRRGFGYFQTPGQVRKVELTDYGFLAEVKGRYKEGYQVKLHAEELPLRPECNCPLEQPWCKHAIAAALTVIDSGYWLRFWQAYSPHTAPQELPPKEQYERLSAAASCQYVILLDLHRDDRYVGIRLIERLTRQPVTQFEKILRLAATIGTSHLNDIEQQEIRLMQWFHKEQVVPFPSRHPLEGWIELPVQKLDHVLRVISQHPLVLEAETGSPFHFYPTPLVLQLSVNASGQGGHVMTSLHWLVPEAPEDYVWDDLFFGHHEHVGDYHTEADVEKVFSVEAQHQLLVDKHGEKRPVIEEIPLEAMRIFSKEVPWGQYRQTLYPLSIRLSMLPKHLVKSTFSDIRDTDGGKFLFEELPKIQRFLSLDFGGGLTSPKLYRRPPVNVLHVELIDPAALRMRISLTFSYDGVEVAYTRSLPENTMYVMVVKQNPDQIYWMKRDLKAEHQAFDHLVHLGVEPIQANFFQAEGDRAIDFIHEIIPSLDKHRWQVKLPTNQNDLNVIKVSKHPLRLVAEIAFEEGRVDMFRLSLSAKVDQLTIDLGQVQNYMLQGKKYFYLDGAGYVEVPLATVLQFGKTIQAFDAETLGPDSYLVQTFKAGLLSELQDQGVILTMDERFQGFWQVMSSSKPIQEVSPATNLHAELRHYQTQGFNWLLFLYNYGLNGILADDMGLGKTLQAITLLQHVKNTQGQVPSLIVAPTSVVFNWVNELKRFAPELQVVNLTGATRFEEYTHIKQADVVVTSYTIMRRDIKALKKYPFRCAILDEAQNIKNPEAQTALAAKEIQANHRLALSGTPIENSLVELWSLFDFLMPGFLYDKSLFRHKYVLPIEEKGNRDAERRLRKQVSPFMLRRLKQDVLSELPPKMESIHHCEMTDEQYDLYLRVLEETRREIMADPSDTGLKKAQAAIFRALIRLRQICCHPMLLDPEIRGNVMSSGKFEALKEFILSAVANGHRILLFSQFVEMLKIIRGWLDEEGMKYCYLTGETRNREAEVTKFNTQENIPLFLISLKAGGTGLNLTGADVVIHYDPWWNPAAEDQATDRAYRIGQNKTVFVYRMITRSSVEEKIQRLQGIKRDLVDSIISADRSAMDKFLTFDSLKEILSSEF
ncbi:MAG: SNF2-related protein [Vampirovibrionales bacterium]